MRALCKKAKAAFDFFKKIKSDFLWTIQPKVLYNQLLPIR